MVLSRKSTYFLLSMILPVYTLCFLNPFVFLLPAASGERISYTITMFLSLAVYMTLVGDNMPKVSEPMAGISYFLLVAMLFSCLLIILTIFTLRCDAVTDVTNFPKCVRRLVLKVKKNRKNTRKPITRNSVDVDSIEFGSKNVPSTSDVSTIELKKENGEQGINANDIDEPDKKDVTNCIDITLFFFAETGREIFEEEIRHWTVRWNIPNTIKPASLQETPPLTNRELYPCVWTMLAILVTMPVSTCSAERSFSSLRRVKTHLRRTMGQERLSSLSILHIHRDMPIDIDAAIEEILAAKRRKGHFGI
ncbi:acetylcholine receptor subunit alpha-like [Mizuhopecten yessoensis]|uniref:acetylcholine receptor subunit alpha-like n=1 Tax=Mizuhopecten yessoensis TaxID=6573 RepID=UPI000B45A3AC|nr:acetylcholine receptor subunit alpha-like [Mizuhopecten yessoensis]